MKNPGIHLRLVLSAVMLIGATTLTLGSIGVKTIHEFVRLRFEERILFLAKYLALNAELGILINERAMLKRLSTNMMSEEDVFRVTIYDSNGEPLADEAKKSSGPLQTLEVPVQLKTSNFDTLAFPGDKPPRIETQVIGKVRIKYSSKGIDQLLSVMKARLAWLAFGLTALAVMIYYFISRSLVSPVTKIATAARQFAKGNLRNRPVPGNLPETRELTLAFNSMLDSIEWSSKALEEAYQEMLRQKTMAELGKFSMMVAHEVKNPLSIIKSSLSLLKKDLGAAAKDNTMIVYMEEEISRLNRLIEDFLLFSKPLNPAYRETDVNGLILQSLPRYQMQGMEFSSEIESNIDGAACWAHADPDLLVRVMDNLMKNAFEAGDAPSKVFISTSCRDGFRTLTIEDEGSGIAEENLQKIFEPFFTTRSKGTGLGLAFVSQVVTAHGGKISAQNRTPGGACFTISLPVLKSRERRA